MILMIDFVSENLRQEKPAVDKQKDRYTAFAIVRPGPYGYEHVADVWWLEDQMERARNVAEYGSRPRLDVFESNEYTHWTAWAHTEPERRVILIRPPESIDYRRAQGVLNHEIVHNFYPGLRDERHVTHIGNGPLFPYIINAFRYSYN